MVHEEGSNEDSTSVFQICVIDVCTSGKDRHQHIQRCKLSRPDKTKIWLRAWPGKNDMLSQSFSQSDVGCRNYRVKVQT